MDNLNQKLVVCRNYRIESEIVTVVKMYLEILSAFQRQYFTRDFLIFCSVGLLVICYNVWLFVFFQDVDFFIIIQQCWRFS